MRTLRRKIRRGGKGLERKEYEEGREEMECGRLTSSFARCTASFKLLVLYSVQIRCCRSAYKTFFVLTLVHIRWHINPGSGGTHGFRSPSLFTQEHFRNIPSSNFMTGPLASVNLANAHMVSFSV